MDTKQLRFALWCVLLCLRLVGSSNRAHGSARSASTRYPSLLRPHASEAVTDALNGLPPDADVVKVAGRPTAQLSWLDIALLKSDPPGLMLELPTIQGSLRVSHRREIQVNAHVDADNGIMNSMDQQRFPTVWVGTVAGFKPGYSAVVFTHDAARSVVRGSVRFWDRRTKSFRLFTIAPVAQQGAVVAAASGSGDSAAAETAASTDTYLTVEVKEPLLVDSEPMQLALVARPDAAAGTEVSPNETVAAASELVVNPSANIGAAVDDTGAISPVHFNPTPLFLSGTKPIPISVSSSPSDSTTPPFTGTDTDNQSTTSGLAEVGCSGSRRLQQTPTVIVQDALVVYTKLAAATGLDVLLSRVQQNFARANLAYRDSKVPVQLTLLAFRQWNYNETGKGHSDILTDVMADAAVTRMRDAIGADLVIAFDGGTYPVGGGFLCGLASVGGGRSMTYANIHSGICMEGYTMAHEVGHNQGCMHPKAQDPSTPQGAVGSYARGWQRCDWPASQSRSFSTIMSYQCFNVSGNTGIGLFSDPALKSAAGIPIGNARDGYCARGLRETAQAIANYRVRKSNPVPAPSPRPSLSPKPRPSPSPAPKPSPPPSNAPQTTWHNEAGCNGTATLLICPTGSTVGLIATRLGRWDMAAGTCPGPTPPTGTTQKSMVYVDDETPYAARILATPADLVGALQGDLYPAGARFGRQYDFTYGCDTQVVFWQPTTVSCVASSYTESCADGFKLHTSSLLIVGKWDHPDCRGAPGSIPVAPMAKAYVWPIPANQKTVALPADIVAAVKEDIYPGVEKMIAWLVGCVKA